MAKPSPLDIAKQAELHSRERGLEQRLARLQAESDGWKARYNSAVADLATADQRAGISNAIKQPIGPDSLKRLKHTGDAVAILALSDWHVEEHVDPAVVNGLNEYTPAIAQKRAERIFQGAVQLVDVARTFAKIDTAVVWLGGDFISGYIHDELQEGNFMSPSEAILFVQDLLVKGIRFFKREAKLKNLVLPTSFGNHGRSTEKRRVASSYANSFEWLMYRNMEQSVKDTGWQWKVENGYFNWVTLFDSFKVRFAHGDNIQYGGGVGGISIPVNKAVAQWNKVQPANLDIFGHYHQMIEMSKWVCNGSLIGYGPYALSIKAEPEPPQQTMVIVSKKRGKILRMPVFAE